MKNTNSGYIVNTDPEWFAFLNKNEITNPVFWFKRESNPNSKSIIQENYIFLRITGTRPPVIKAFGRIGGITVCTVQQALKKYKNRLGYDSLNSMIEHSAAWTSKVKLTPNTKIFCVEIYNFKLINDIRVDQDLESLGILFDYHHIVTGKGLSNEQASALLQITNEINPTTFNQIEEFSTKEPLSNYNPTEIEDFTSESARYLESHLQWFIFNNIACLGIPNARLYDGSLQSEKQGKYWTGEVGEIDLLLRSSNNDIYVVELKKTGTDKTVGQIARYMGWVKHRLAKNGETVYGIIVTQDYDHRLSYAATVVNNLCVKRIHVAFTINSEQSDLPE